MCKHDRPAEREALMRRAVLAMLTACAWTTAASVQPAPTKSLQWITLGTKGGPVPNAERSQPANALIVAGKPWIVDCGDGAMERLAGAGFKPTDVDAVFISHLHLDHVGGLQGLIGLRWMMGADTPLTVYGPPGTERLVAAILQSLAPSLVIARDEPMKGLDPARMVKTVVLRGGDHIERGDVRISVVRNSHFDNPPGHPLDNASQSLSYRFDDRGYAITYTGDTGPSAAVEQLATGSNVLVSEVIDLARTEEMYAAKRDLSAAQKKAMLNHLTTQHLSAVEVGKMAANAHVGMVILTHLSNFPSAPAAASGIVAEVQRSFPGKVVVARDLDRF